MKIKTTETIIIPVPEQFSNAWQATAYAWINENNDNYPDAVIESVNPNIDYFKRCDGEIEIVLSRYQDALTAELPF